MRQGVVWFEHAGLADAGKRASTASVGGADGAAALHMHEAGGEVQWSGKKFSGVFERRRRMKIYRPLAMLTGVCARYKKLG